VGRYQKGKTNLDFTEARDSEWQWHQLGHTQVCTSLQTDNHASTSPLSFFTGRMPFLPPNQQRQSACENCEKNGGNECMRIFVLVQTPDVPPVNALKETLSNVRYQRKSPVNLVLSQSTN